MENYETSFANLVTNKKLSETYEKNLILQGITKIVDKEGFGSTDMGDVSHCCPTIHPSFPLTTNHLTGHSVEFASVLLYNQKLIREWKEAAIAMALTAMDIFTNPQLLKEIKEEFKNSSK